MSTLPTVISRFVDYYTALDSQPPSALAGLYDPEATLIDPFGEHNGLFAIQRYFTHLLANVENCRFSIDPPLSNERRFVVTWTMHWSHPRIAGGEQLELPGCSVVDVVNDLIVRQRDYYDAGEMIYEHLPVLGWAVRGVKRRVKS
ncbi:nuclear transport factor 2 family protein [Enterobacter wuhouensis]|uniref:nuclear transport factor 2 family protein n=1 Tax=Enterobacter wuhouensis TaxID=2529381 RepID=UPI0035255450